MAIGILKTIVPNEIFLLKSGTNSSPSVYLVKVVPPNTLGDNGDFCEHTNGIKYEKINNVWETSFSPITEEVLDLSLSLKVDKEEGKILSSNDYSDDDKNYLNSIVNPMLFKGDINLPIDFPTLSEVRNGWTYLIKTAVTDNNATKTNTGASFLVDSEVSWNGTSWSVLGVNTVNSVNGQYGNVNLDLQKYLGVITTPSTLDVTLTRSDFGKLVLCSAIIPKMVTLPSATDDDIGKWFDLRGNCLSMAVRTIGAYSMFYYSRGDTITSRNIQNGEFFRAVYVGNNKYALIETGFSQTFESIQNLQFSFPIDRDRYAGTFIMAGNINNPITITLPAIDTYDGSASYKYSVRTYCIGSSAALVPIKDRFLQTTGNDRIKLANGTLVSNVKLPLTPVILIPVYVSGSTNNLWFISGLPFESSEIEVSNTNTIFSTTKVQTVLEEISDKLIEIQETPQTVNPWWTKVGYFGNFNTPLELVGSSPIASSPSNLPKDVSVDDSNKLAFMIYQSLTSSEGSLRIYDIRYLDDIKLLSEISLPKPSVIEYKNNFCYIGCAAGEFYIVDVSIPTLPDIISTLSIGGSLEIRDLAINDLENTVFVASISAGGGLKIIDITNKATPTIISDTEIFLAGGVEYQDNHIFMTDVAQKRLKIYDVTDRTNPSIITNFLVGDKPASITVHDNGYCYIGEYSTTPLPNQKVFIIDISNLLTPVIMSSISLPGALPNEGGFSESIQKTTDHWLYTFTNTGLPKITIWNTSDKANPKKAFEYILSGTKISGGIINNGYIFIPNLDNHCLEVFNDIVHNFTSGDIVSDRLKVNKDILFDEEKSLISTFDAVSLSSKTIYVNNKRIDNYVETGSINFPFKKLSSAVTISTSGDTIKLINSEIPYSDAGVYTLNFPEGVSLEGDGCERVKIESTDLIFSGTLPIQMKNIFCDGGATIFSCSAIIKDCYLTNSLVVNDCHVEAYNLETYVDAGLSISLNGETSELNIYNGKITSISQWYAIEINDGKLTLDNCEVVSDVDDSSTIIGFSDVSISPIIITNSSIINTGLGKSLSITNAAEITNPHKLDTVYFSSEVDFGSSAVNAFNISFNPGSLIGTNIEYNNKKEFSNSSMLVSLTGDETIIHNLNIAYPLCTIYFKPASGTFQNKWVLSDNTTIVLEYIDKNSVKIYNISSEPFDIDSIKIIINI